MAETQGGTGTAPLLLHESGSLQPERAVGVEILANVISCVLDEALLSRVGNFAWTTSKLGGEVRHSPHVSVNRWERACEHFWDTLFTAPVEVSDEDRHTLVMILEDSFKAASRCRAGDVCYLMDHSIWATLLAELKEPQKS